MVPTAPTERRRFALGKTRLHVSGVETPMLARTLLGMSVGGGLGAAYGAFGHCSGGHCLVQWSPTPPALIGAAIGFVLVRFSRWD